MVAPGPYSRQLPPPSSTLSIPIHQILDAEEHITARLEDTAELKGPRYFSRRREEPKHLHPVAQEPTRKHRQPEPLAGLRPRIGEYLG
jgi:hypothetical protein